MVLIYLLVATIALIIGISAGFILRKITVERRAEIARISANAILENAQKEAANILKEAELESKDKIIKLKSEFEAKTREERMELQNLEKRLRTREENIDKKTEALEKKEKQLLEQEKKIKTMEDELNNLIKEQRRKLESISGLSAEAAKNELINSMINDAKQASLATIKKIEDETKENAEKKAREILAATIQRIAADYTSETSVSVIPLPNEEMKGRIIGREGRNIKSLENLTGVDFIIDDTPEAVTISAFDPIRREIAKQSLEKLIADGRIHPGKIEEIVEKTKAEMDAKVKEIGERTCLDLGITNLHPELIKLLGKLHYRSSYGQNVLQHSIEMAYIASILASELGINPTVVKRAALLHDIGKAIDHEIEGSHVQLGVEIAKKYGESEKVIHAIEAHHNDVEPKTLEAVLVQAADAISAARPGARKETLENYIKRLETLEKIASEFEGVVKSYAIQAGREIRIIVEPASIDDLKAYQLSKDIAKKIESELEYPGQIKVTVVREVRAIEYAK